MSEFLPDDITALFTKLGIQVFTFASGQNAASRTPHERAIDQRYDLLNGAIFNALHSYFMAVYVQNSSLDLTSAESSPYQFEFNKEQRPFGFTIKVSLIHDIESEDALSRLDKFHDDLLELCDILGLGGYQIYKNCMKNDDQGPYRISYHFSFPHCSDLIKLTRKLLKDYHVDMPTGMGSMSANPIYSLPYILSLYDYARGIQRVAGPIYQ